MGIELPTPFPGGNGSPENTVDHRFGARSGETARSTGEVTDAGYTVEKNSSNNEALKEVVNGRGTGDASGQPGYIAVTNTTNIPHTDDAQGVVAVLDDVPVVAADEDLIEKVWVDAVKSAITRTAGDPYARGQAISRLQADYLNKRYGKTMVQE